MGWFAEKKAEKIRVSEDKLYQLSSPLPNEGMGGVLHNLLQKAGIKDPPEIRASGSLGHGGMALTGKDAVLVNTSTPEPVLKALTAHEVAHVVFGDTGELTKKQEHRSDRFAVFLTGEGAALSDYLRTQDKTLQEEFGMFREAGIMGKIAAGLRSLKNNKMYGSIEERVANIERQITDAERVAFHEAIEVYNTRKASRQVGQELVSVPLPPAKTGASQLSQGTAENVAAISNALSQQNGGQLQMEAVDGIFPPKLPDSLKPSENKRA